MISNSPHQLPYISCNSNPENVVSNRTLSSQLIVYFLFVVFLLDNLLLTLRGNSHLATPGSGRALSPQSRVSSRSYFVHKLVLPRNQAIQTSILKISHKPLQVAGRWKGDFLHQYFFCWIFLFSTEIIEGQTFTQVGVITLYMHQLMQNSQQYHAKING